MHLMKQRIFASLMGLSRSTAYDELSVVMVMGPSQPCLMRFGHTSMLSSPCASILSTRSTRRLICKTHAQQHTSNSSLKMTASPHAHGGALVLTMTSPVPVSALYS